MNKGILYIVATPIGNLKDITYRAVQTLQEVDRIACEDTRVTQKLLARYEITKPLLSYHQHSGEKTIYAIIKHLERGENIALVTDAGTPGLSDPGGAMIAEALKKDIQIIPIPGVSALATAVSISGIDMKEFIFKGFPPHKKGRQTYFKEVIASKKPVVYHESPHRVVKNLQLLQEFGSDQSIIVGRELTKMFESVYRGAIEDILDHFERNSQEIKGEFVIIVHRS